MSLQSTRGVPFYQPGQQVGRWTILSGPYRHPTWPKNRHPHWRCRCACGTEATIVQGQLRSGHSRSCGCLRREMVAAKNHRHGQSKTLVYRRWKGMIDRCTNPAGKNWKDYGGRGITIHPAWRESFLAFLDHMGQPPSPRHEIDRYPDNDGNYEPGNVRWATHKDNCQNTRRTRR